MSLYTPPHPTPQPSVHWQVRSGQGNRLESLLGTRCSRRRRAGHGRRSSGWRPPPAVGRRRAAPAGAQRSPRRWSPCRCQLTAGPFAVARRLWLEGERRNVSHWIGCWWTHMHWLQIKPIRAFMHQSDCQTHSLVWLLDMFPSHANHNGHRLCVNHWSTACSSDCWSHWDYQ